MMMLEWIILAVFAALVFHREMPGPKRLSGYFSGLFKLWRLMLPTIAGWAFCQYFAKLWLLPVPMGEGTVWKFALNLAWDLGSLWVLIAVTTEMISTARRGGDPLVRLKSSSSSPEYRTKPPR